MNTKLFKIGFLGIMLTAGILVLGGTASAGGVPYNVHNVNVVKVVSPHGYISVGYNNYNNRYNGYNNYSYRNDFRYNNNYHGFDNNFGHNGYSFNNGWGYGHNNDRRFDNDRHDYNNHYMNNDHRR